MPVITSLKNAFERGPGPGRLQEKVSLADHTTFKIGGPADLFFEATSADELVQAIQIARAHELPFFLLGMGANILVGDKGFRGLVIQNHASGTSIDTSNGLVHCETGVTIWPDLIELLVDAELSGLEHFAGIPSSVGGALWQNLHFLSPAPERARTIFLDEVFHSAVLLTPTGKLITVDRDYFEFGYDTSILHYSGDIAISATFKLTPSQYDVMKQIVRSNLEWRSKRHPPLDTEPSAGSIFQKIDGIGAGRLIDGCGMKGHMEGGIEISRRHANIMVNRGGGTATDVRKLIDLTIATVKAETGYELIPEIAFVGEFE